MGRPLWKVPPKQLNMELPFDPEIPFWLIYPKKIENKGSKKYSCTPIQSNVIHGCEKVKGTQVSRMGKQNVV